MLKYIYCVDNQLYTQVKMLKLLTVNKLQTKNLNSYKLYCFR